MKYDVAAYIWPAYAGDEPRTRMFWPEGNGEWQTVMSAQAKFEGHQWPRRPLWGCQNEADPAVMQMQIEQALAHGVNVFIYDWYWYDRRPFLENCLNDGFLKAPNCRDMKFYLMWANHDAVTLWDKRISSDVDAVIWEGSQPREEFERAMKRMIEKYFSQPNYYTIDEKPVLMIYDVPNLVRGLGGMEQTKDAIEWLRHECVCCGLKGIHLQFAMWSDATTNLSGVDGCRDLPAAQFGQLGFDSATHYQYVHFVDIDRSYADVLPDVTAEWKRLDNELDVPYFAHVSLGWDNNPRFVKLMPQILRDCTPEHIERALRMAKDYADAHPGQPPLITVNSWNEWTESSYLLPDDLNGYGYLQAVRRVFLQEEA